MAYNAVLEEVNQGHSTRQQLYEQLERALGNQYLVISFFTSLVHPVVIEDQDGDMIEEVLQTSDSQGKHLALILNSPGGLAVPAERIVNILRSHSDNGFTVVVPKMAKSAATMICFGAEEIWMSPTSELGPIDPQVPIFDERGRIVQSLGAHEVIESYQDLMKKANRTRGRIEPFLQQLARFDARDIRKIISAQMLSESIALKNLKSGMMRGSSEVTIKKKIRPFLDPSYTKVHGRPIYHDVAEQCGLKVRVFNLKSPEWQTVWNLYIRLNNFVSRQASKVIETTKHFYAAPIPRFEGHD